MQIETSRHASLIEQPREGKCTKENLLQLCLHLGKKKPATRNEICRLPAWATLAQLHFRLQKKGNLSHLSSFQLL